MKRGRGTVNTTAALIIISVSLLIGFILFRNANPLADTAEQGVDTFQQLNELNEQLEASP